MTQDPRCGANLVERDHKPPHLLHERKDLPWHSPQCGDSGSATATARAAFATAGSVGHGRCTTSTWTTGAQSGSCYLLAIRPRFGELGLDNADEDRQLTHLRSHTAAVIDEPTRTVSRSH